MTITILHLLCVVLETPTDNLFGLKRNRKRTNMTLLEGEAVALPEALHFAIGNRWNQVVFESDSSTLCKLYRLRVMVIQNSML